MAFVCDQDGGPPLASDLDQGAGEEVNARQVEPGGKSWRHSKVFSWREGGINVTALDWKF